MSRYKQLFTSKDNIIYQCVSIRPCNVALINRIFKNLLMIEPANSSSEYPETYIIYKFKNGNKTDQYVKAESHNKLLVAEDGDISITDSGLVTIGESGHFNNKGVNTVIKSEDARYMYHLTYSLGRHDKSLKPKLVKTIYKGLQNTEIEFDIQIPITKFTESDTIRITHHNAAPDDMFEVNLHFGDYLIIDYSVDKDTLKKSNYRIYSMSEDAVNQSKNIILI